MIIHEGVHGDLKDPVRSWTSDKGHLAVFKLLLESGTNVDDQDIKGWTALMDVACY